jgi:hypothetical protein
MLPKYASKPYVWLLTAAVACIVSISCATGNAQEKAPPEKEQSEQKKEQKAGPAEKAEQEVVVYTNKDLERMFGESEESADLDAPAADEPAEERKPIMEIKVEPEPGEQPPASDPLAVMRQRKEMDEARAQAVAEAEKAVADARERVTQLEQRILALRNPYSARPQIPEDEKADWDSMGTRERLEKSEEQLAQAREELEAAEKELDAIR